MRAGKNIFIALGLFYAMAVDAQFLHTSYFMEGSTERLRMNPGLQPERGYFTVPLVGSLNVASSSNVLSIDDVVDVLDSRDDLYRNDDLYARLKDKNRLNVSVNTDIFSAGWYRGKNFWSVNVGLRADVGASVPRLMFEYLRVSNGYDLSMDLQHYDIRNQQMDMSMYGEIGVGYSRQVTDRLTVGGRAKLLLGIAHAELDINRFAVDVNMPEDMSEPEFWINKDFGTAEADADVSATVKGVGLSFSKNASGQRIVNGFDLDDGGFGIVGEGFGVDFGAAYRLSEEVTLSASVLDLGFISWNEGSTTMAQARGKQVINRHNVMQYLGGHLMDMDMYSLKEQVPKARKTFLSSTVLLAGEYAFSSKKMSVGMVYSARFVKPDAVSELTLLAAWRPRHWLNASISYSPVRSGGKSLGLAVQAGPVFVGSDYLFFGKGTKVVNGFFGLSFPLGARKTDK